MIIIVVPMYRMLDADSCGRYEHRKFLKHDIYLSGPRPITVLIRLWIQRYECALRPKITLYVHRTLNCMLAKKEKLFSQYAYYDMGFSLAVRSLVTRNMCATNNNVILIGSVIGKHHNLYNSVLQLKTK